MMVQRLFFVTLASLLLIIQGGYSQAADSSSTADSTSATEKGAEYVKVEMKNGASYYGTLVKLDSTLLILEMENGTLSINKGLVASINYLEEISKFRFLNPSASNYFFSSSAIPLEEGEVSYKNTMLFLNTFNFGVNENFSIGAGFEIISTILGNPIWFLSPKVRHEISRNNFVGGGVVLAGAIGEVFGSAVYLNYSRGNQNSNITIGGGVGTIAGETSTSPVFTISAMHRISNGVVIKSENFVANNEGSFALIGLHGIGIISEESSLDFGFLTAVVSDADFTSGGLVPIPIISYKRVF